MTEEMKPFDNSKGRLNESVSTLLDNIAANTTRTWQQLRVYPVRPDDMDVMIVGGGPSTEEHLEEIREYRENGGKVMALNGAFNYLLDQGIEPSGLICVDGREFNKRFVSRMPEAPDAKVFLASQCHPATFQTAEEFVPVKNRYIFHTFGRYEELEDVEGKTDEELLAMPNRLVNMLDGLYYGPANRNYYFVVGGSTVALRAMWMMRMLGFKRQRLVGVDSCIYNHTHHVYAQPENDQDEVGKITCAEREFWCTNWMASQAKEFIDFIRSVGDELELSIYGDGLLAWIITKGAEAVEVEQ